MVFGSLINVEKSSRKRKDIARLVQSPTGIQRELLTPGEFAAAEGTDTKDESGSETDFRWTRWSSKSTCDILTLVTAIQVTM